MRITQQMVASDMIASLSLNYQTIDTLGKELASGKSLIAPSDNPAAVSSAINLQASLTTNAQYQTTTTTAQNWLETTSSSLQQLSQVAIRARTLAVQGADDTNTAQDRTQMATEVTQLMQQVTQIGNTTYAGSSIFAGTAVTTTPFNAIGGYQGDSGKITHEIAPGYTMQVNANPTTIFTGQGGVYHVLQQLQQHLANGDGPVAPQNTGTEVSSLTGAYAGNFPYQVAVTGVTGGAISQIQYSIDGTHWTTVNGAGASPNYTFSLGSGMTASFTNGATPAVGDTFSFGGTAGAAASGFAITNGVHAGTESLALTGTDTGVLNFLTKVTGVTSNAVSAVQYTTDNGQNWISATATGTAPNLAFAFGATGVTATYTNGSVFPAVGDQFGFTAQPGATVSGYATKSGPNTGNESATITGAFTGTGAPQFVFKMGALDANNNVVSVQVSTDGGKTFGSTLTATNYTGTALTFPTTTTFDLGQGLTLNLNQSTGSLPQVGASGDTLTYQTQATTISNDLTAIDSFVSTLSGQMAQFGAETNAAQNNLTQMQAQSDQLTSALSQTVNADYAAISTQMATAQTLYQAALAVDAKSVEPSLVEFLK